jgi:hypothetical protein
MLNKREIPAELEDVVGSLVEALEQFDHYNKLAKIAGEREMQVGNNLVDADCPENKSIDEKTEKYFNELRKNSQQELKNSWMKISKYCKKGSDILVNLLKLGENSGFTLRDVAHLLGINVTKQIETTTTVYEGSEFKGSSEGLTPEYDEAFFERNEGKYNFKDGVILLSLKDEQSVYAFLAMPGIEEMIKSEGYKEGNDSDLVPFAYGANVDVCPKQAKDLAFFKLQQGVLDRLVRSYEDKQAGAESDEHQK